MKIADGFLFRFYVVVMSRNRVTFRAIGMVLQTGVTHEYINHIKMSKNGPSLDLELLFRR